MISLYFIRRPVFATVLSIVIVLLGLVALPRLPISQYPDITPPLVTVTTSYPGASGQVVSETVATPIEQQINGADNMLYMESICTSDGSMTINVTFEIGTDPNIDQVLVQNRTAIALPQTPDLVQKQGVITRKSSPSILVGIAFYSPDDRYDATFLSNYLKIQVYDELLRVSGVGQVNLLGGRDYSMRIWLDPDKLANLSLAPMDAVKAVQEQNIQVAAGILGAPPVPAGVDSFSLINVEGRLQDIKQFEDIVVFTGKDGSIVRLRDVGRVELGAQSYTQNVTFDGKPSVLAACYALPGTNAIDVANALYKKLDELSAAFPKGIAYDISYDTTQFIRESSEAVFWTLIESSILVSMVIFIFLQSWRSALIPIISLPVSIIGTFAIMSMFGFSLNTLSLFGLILAIGIVVDDAIVVVENVERCLEEGDSPLVATERSMREISGAIIAMTLVLSCVFIPAAFITGITGAFYIQFALTIAGATVISGLNSLTLSPALCVILLQPKSEHGHGPILPRVFWVVVMGLIGGALTLSLFAGAHFEFVFIKTIADSFMKEGFEMAKLWWFMGGVGIGAIAGFFLGPVFNGLLRQFFKLFNWGFDVGTNTYVWIVQKLLRVALIVLLVYGGLLFVTLRLAGSVPVGFIPELDKGYFLVAMKLPDGASLERTDEVVKKVNAMVKDQEGVGHTIGVSGFSLVTGSSSFSAGTIICTMKPFADRTETAARVNAVVGRLRRDFGSITQAIVAAFGAPPVDGLGRSSGFKLQIQDRNNMGPNALDVATRKLIRAASVQPGLVGVSTSFSASLPQLFVDVNRTQAKQMSVNLSDVFQTLQIYIGSLYVNQINLYGRTWQVNIQAEAPFRLNEEDLGRLRVRNSQGDMVPISGIISVRRVTGPEKVTRYNMFPSADVVGGVLPNLSSGQVIDMMEELARRELPQGMQIQWTDLYLQQIKAGNTTVYVFLFGGLMVFLVLAAQYESWTLPIAVVMIVPMCVLCALTGVALRGMDNNIFVQIGLLVLIGLSSKNAILIVEFAKQQREEGHSRMDATLAAARTRLRPILMTSFCFIHMVPLYFATGAGAEMRQYLGTAVLWGAFGVTAIGIFLTPTFYFLIDWMTHRGEVEKTPPTPMNPE